MAAAHGGSPLDTLTEILIIFEQHLMAYKYAVCDFVMRLQGQQYKP